MTKRQSKVLWTVLGVNAVMFVVELASGIQSYSLALTGDSLDMFGDAIAYGSSLYVINRGRKAQAKSAMLKGFIMFLSAVAVFARAIYQAFFNTTPELRVMSIVGFIALIANLFCLFLLTSHRNDNINMSSVKKYTAHCYFICLCYRAIFLNLKVFQSIPEHLEMPMV
jgi:Co/Zn/Cd efflux system component